MDSQTSGWPADWRGSPPIATAPARSLWDFWGSCSLTPCFYFWVPTFPFHQPATWLCDVSWVTVTTRRLLWPFPAGCCKPEPLLFLCCSVQHNPQFLASSRPGAVVLQPNCHPFSVETPSSLAMERHPSLTSALSSLRPGCRSQQCMTSACSCLSLWRAAGWLCCSPCLRPWASGASTWHRWRAPARAGERPILLTP